MLDYSNSVNPELLELCQRHIIKAIRSGVSPNLVPSPCGSFSVHMEVRQWNVHGLTIGDKGLTIARYMPPEGEKKNGR